MRPWVADFFLAGTKDKFLQNLASTSPDNGLFGLFISQLMINCFATKGLKAGNFRGH
jgi:hypothetical protein